MSSDGKKYNYSVIFFSSADSFEVLVISLASADRRPTIGPTSNKKTSHSISADCPPIIGRLSADDRRSSTDCRPTKRIVGYLSADNRPIVGPHKTRPHIFVASMYAYLVIFAFSKCFLPLAKSDLVQTINSIILYNMRMRNEAKMPYDFLMRRPTVGRSSPDSLYAVPHVNVVGRRSADGRPIVSRLSADRKTLQLIKVIGEVCFNVIAPVGRQNCIHRPIKMQNSCRRTIGRLSVLM